jgi:hypothetical protein
MRGSSLLPAPEGPVIETHSARADSQFERAGQRAVQSGDPRAG